MAGDTFMNHAGVPPLSINGGTIQRAIFCVLH